MTGDGSLVVRDLRVQFGSGNQGLKAVRGISFDVERGECLGVVGESGSGKSLTCLAILDLVPHPGEVSGDLRLNGRKILGRKGEELRSLHGKEAAMIFQDPNSALNPLITVERQLIDVIRAHQEISKSAARSRAAEVLDAVGFPDPIQRMKSYPFELSGGLKQRVAIALALSCSPTLILADEPTTSLDVSTEDQVLQLFRNRQIDEQFAAIFVSHDIDVVSRVANQMMVMYAGSVVESGSTRDILTNPLHPYTRGLLNSAPSLLSDRSVRLQGIPGTTPDLANVPDGCPFQDRCPERSSGQCHPQEPNWHSAPDELNHRVYCYEPQNSDIR